MAVNTRLFDEIFEKYAAYSGSLVFKDAAEASENETDESKEEYRVFIKRLNDKGYFGFLAEGKTEIADRILKETEKYYYEKNEYYINLKKLNSLNSYYFLRNLSHLELVPTPNRSMNVSAAEVSKFNKIYSEELDYFKVAYYRYDFQDYPLFNKLAVVFIIFSTIMRLMKVTQSLSLTDPDINEYHLNNFMASHGFLFFNHMNYSRKKSFIKCLMDFYNNKGSLKTVKKIINILNDRDVDIYEYYLFYDWDLDKYFFLRVKPTESFIQVFNEIRFDREEDYFTTVAFDDSWQATEEDLKELDVRFIKTKYFSIDSYSDITDASTELSLLINKTRKYRDELGVAFTFDLQGFSEGVEISDFLMFLTLLSARVNGYSKEYVTTIDCNEDMKKYLLTPIMYESSIESNKDKGLSDIILESVREQNVYNGLLADLEAYKKGSKIHKTETIVNAIRHIRKEMTKNYTHVYRPAVLDTYTVSSYQYLINKYPIMKEYLDEEDRELIKSQFLAFIEDLEATLILYGQAVFKFKDIYASFFLPKITEIINFFKSLNSYLFEFNSTLLVEKDSRQDIMGDSHSIGGLIKISNRDKIGSGGSGDPAYKPDPNFPNKDKVVDRPLDVSKEIIAGEELWSCINRGHTIVATSDGKTTHKDHILHDFPEAVSDKAGFTFRSFGGFSKMVSEQSTVFDTAKKVERILEDEEKYYFEGKVLDFYGSEDSYKEIREKLGLSYLEFKEKIGSILQKYNFIYGSVVKVSSIEQQEFLYNRNKRLPFMRKPYIFRKVANKVRHTDIVYQKISDRTSYTDLLFVYEYNKESDTYEYSEKYNSKFRSLVRKEDPRFVPEDVGRFNGMRDYKEFIKSVIIQSENIQAEEDIIGFPDIPD